MPKKAAKKKAAKKKAAKKKAAKKKAAKKKKTKKTVEHIVKIVIVNEESRPGSGCTLGVGW